MGDVIIIVMADVMIVFTVYRFCSRRTGDSEELDFSVLRASRDREFEAESVPMAPKSRLNKIAEKACVVSLVTHCVVCIHNHA